MPTPFGVALRKARKEMGYTQRDVDIFAVIPDGCTSQLERGIRNPTPEMVASLSEILKVTLTYQSLEDWAKEYYGSNRSEDT
jgi:hypothetical protein